MYDDPMATPGTVDTWERLVRFHRLATTQMDDRLREACGRSLDEYDVLHQVHAHSGPIRMGVLAERLLIANSSCNRLVGRLVAAGLLARTSGETDRREVLVELTPEGRRVRRRMAAVHTRDIERAFFPRISEAELARLGSILERLLDGDD